MSTHALERDQRARVPMAAPQDVSGAPPGPRASRHLLGAHWLLSEHRLLHRCRERYGSVFSLRIWPLGLLVVVSDPVEIKRLFTADPEVVQAGAGNSVTEPVAGPESVLLLDGAPHLHRRKLMLPAFHGERLTVYEQLISDAADDEIDRWALHRAFPIHTSMQSITLRVILRAVLGVEDAGKAADLVRLIPKLINSPALMWPPLRRNFGPLGPWRRFLVLRDQIDVLMYEEMALKRSDRLIAEREDILSMLLLARDEQGEAMSDLELRDQLVTLLLAGHETSATALAWTFERLLRNPVVLARLRESLEEGEEEYLDCVIKESLRSRPIIPYAMRRVTAPVDVCGYTVPTGSFIGASTILLHSDPSVYPEPDAFRPERFLDKRADTYTWIPFGGGVRRCLGSSFATLEMRVVLRRVLERCELAVPDQRPERPRRRFVTYPPSRGSRVVVTARVARQGVIA